MSRSDSSASESGSSGYASVSGLPAGHSRALMAERSLPPALLVASLLVVVGFAAHSGIGFDLTDEGFYLNWIADPYAYPHSVTLFGFVYHPFYALVDGDVARLRQFNVLLTYGLACWCAWTVWCSVVRAPLGSLAKTTVAAVLAIPSLLVLAGYTATPSYNTLCLQGMLIALIGAIMCGRDASLRNLSGWGLLTLGTWVAFMAKPPSALLLGVTLLVFVLATGRATLGRLAASAALGVAMVAITGAMVDGSITQFVKRFYLGYLNVQLQETGHDLQSIIRWDWVRIGNRLKAGLLLLFGFGVALGHLSRRSAPAVRLPGVVLAAAAAGFAVLITAWWWTPDWPIGMRRPRLPILLAFPAGYLLATAWPSREIRFPTRHALVLCGVCFALMYCFAFGSNVNYVRQMVRAGFFGVLGLGVLAAPLVTSESFGRRMGPMLAGILAVSGTLFYGAAHEPKEQPQPIHMQSTSLQGMPRGSSLIVSEEMAEYLGTLAHATLAAGFRPGDPLLDFTGHHPGVPFILGARAIGSPYLNGNRKGPIPRILSALDTVSCGELARAWILLEPGGPARIPATILSRYGISMERDYREVTRLQSLTTRYPKSSEQILLAPTDSARTSATCRALRAGQTGADRTEQPSQRESALHGTF